uniref:VWFC domain-containing protein n=1 Tax=Anopheles quadriannulatus TaxID=34691 RepID=A0A182X5D6_ANOQN
MVMALYYCKLSPAIKEFCKCAWSAANGFVECEQESCPAVDDCYIYKKKGPDECCDKCIGCLYEGRHIDSGTEWTNPDDPCMHYKCVSGVVTRSEMKCYAPCSDPSPPRKGQCCPTCL